MPPPLIDLRPAVIEDAPLAADLEGAIKPDHERDPEMMAFWWSHPIAGERAHRLIATKDGIARMFVAAGHASWEQDPARYGWVRVRIRPDEWSEEAYRDGLSLAERWLREEDARTSVARVRADLENELRVLAADGYTEVRRSRVWRLDLVKGGDRLLAKAESCRAEMRRQGVTMLTLDHDRDPDGLRKLYELDVETGEDIPKTLPWPVPSFEEWEEHWFEHPGHRRDRFWIARDGDKILGLSIIGYPPQRGIPWTSYTCTARSARGRGIARALKYETIAQAIELGATLVETQNDAENAPILHLNEEMGYEPVTAVIELHRAL